MLELDEGKLSRPVLRRGGESNLASLSRPIGMSVSRFTVYGLLCLHCKEAPRMASVRCINVQARPMEFQDVTSVARDECQQLVPPVEAVFQAPLAA